MILLILDSSVGELHFILPYLIKVKEKHNLPVYTYFINSKLYHKVNEDSYYAEKITEISQILKPNQLLGFLIRNRTKINLILKDTSSIRSSSIVFKLKHICTGAKLVMFPHAYSLLGVSNDHVPPDDEKNKDYPEIDHVLYAHPYDKNTVARNYAGKKLIFSGALGYSTWYQAQIRQYVKQNVQNSIPKNREVVLLTLRHVHDLFLSRDNYNYLIENALDVLINNRRSFVLIKPHPRQSISDLNEVLKKYDSSSYCIDTCNIFILANQADINVSFWSSAITDSLAVGIPTVEFHRYHKKFSQVVENDGKLESFFSFLKLTKKAESREELEKILEEERTELLTRQKKSFDAVFHSTDEGFENFEKLATTSAAERAISFRHRYKLWCYFLSKSIYRTLKPI